ncbi:MAG: HypC/HybG/HupF family hydrogenase formation chaperone [Syntrophales bacterium]
MCLGIPVRIEEIQREKGLVTLGNVRMEVNLTLLADDLAAGDYVLVHAGFAIAKVDEREARETISLIKGMIADEVCR